MRRLLIPCALLVLCASLAAGAAQAGRKAEAVKLNFATYVWQPTTVAATKSIVEAWNKSHPGIQVSIVPVDVNSVHDKLLTNFVGGTAADVIHDEAADIGGFTQQGYLANLSPLISKRFKASIPQSLWNTVNFGRNKVTGVPILMQTYNVFANMDILKARASRRRPRRARGRGRSSARSRSASRTRTASASAGACGRRRRRSRRWRSTSAASTSTSRAASGTSATAPPSRRSSKHMHDMIHVDKSVDAAATGLSGSGVLPAFFGGRCAMTVQGNFAAQGMILQGPRDFNWAMFPLLKGTTQNQVANPQTLSISQQSDHKREAMQFIEYFANAANLAKLAAGDWLIPANPASGKLILKSTKRTGSWRVATSSVVHFQKGNWVTLAAYARWKAEVATPQFVRYLKNEITLEELGKALSDGWTRVR